MRPTRSFLSFVALSTGRPRPELARVDAEVRELADVRVAHDLEREGRERLVVGRGALDRLAGLQLDALDRRDVDRAREVVDDGVEQGLHALVLERRAAEHRDDLAAHGRDADRRAQVVFGDLLFADVLLEHVLVELADDVDELVAPVLGFGLEVGRDVDGLVALAHPVVPDERLHLEQVDDATELALGADRQLGERDGRLEAVRIMSTQRKKSAPTRSILLMKHIRGTLYLLA